MFRVLKAPRLASLNELWLDKRWVLFSIFAAQFVKDVCAALREAQKHEDLPEDVEQLRDRMRLLEEVLERHGISTAELFVVEGEDEQEGNIVHAG